MRIGILKADSVRDEFQSQFGDYQGMFQRVLDSVGNDALEYRTYDVLAGDYPESIDLVSQGVVRLGPMVTHVKPLSELAQALAMLKDNTARRMKIIIDHSS